MMQSMFDWLDRIRQRPSMYVHQWSLKDLKLLCHGYEAALHVHEIAEPGSNFNQSFANWLATKRHWSLNCGWADAILSSLFFWICIDPLLLQLLRLLEAALN
jgi:hypothetical protein